MKIQYDGTSYCGWQKQSDVPTVQGEIEKALSILCDKEISVNGCSRTDAGVHAYSQMASFCDEFAIPTANMKYAINNMLPDDIYVLELEEVEEDFHARFNCNGKKYIYKILNGENRNPFMTDRAYYVRRRLDLNRMRKASEYIVGTKDFKSFEASGSNVRENTVRTVYDISITKEPCEERESIFGVTDEIRIEVSGDGFLYNMVRIIVGTLVDVGLGKIDVSSVESIVNGCDRRLAGHTAPPQGLYLGEVYYGEETELG